MKPVFDYGNITDEQKNVVDEIIKILNQFDQPMIAELLRSKFELEPIKEFDLSTSKFVKYCEAAGLRLHIQGTVCEGEHPNKISYPILTLQEDVRHLDKLIDFIKNN